MSEVLNYSAAPVASAFHRSDLFVRALMGPLGSGKTVSCVMELLRRACEQTPSRKGVRKTKWAVIRNTYRELIDTTIKIFFEWIPENQGTFSKIDMQFVLRSPLPDGTMVEAEFLFRALDRPVDVKKVLSLNLTGAFINEGREVPRVVLEAVSGRCGRYPSMRDGGPTWHGVIIDTNPPDTDHWWYKLFEEECPPNHKLFKQPSGISPQAENIQNLPKDYYKNLMLGKDQEWINVYVHGNYGFITDGKPVFPEYNDSLHYADNLVFTPPRGSRACIGIDFGLTPAAVLGFVTPGGQVVVVDELCTFDMGAMSFGKLLRQKMTSPQWRAHDFTGEIWGDPAGEQRVQTDEQTPFQVLAAQGVEAVPCYTNDFILRREAVGELLSRLVLGGKPALLVGPGAPMLRRALGGGYKYRRLQLGGEQRFVEKPDKNKFSHVADALQYLVLGALGDSAVLGGATYQALDYSRINRSVV